LIIKYLFIKAFECFELGRIAYHENDFYHTVIWMTEALELLKLEKDASLKKDILDYLAISTYKVNSGKIFSLSII